MRTRATVASLRHRFTAAFAASARVRWAVFVVALLVGWLLFFWLINLPTHAASSAPVSTVVPTGQS